MKTLTEREKRDRERSHLVREAIESADKIIMDGCDGTVEELNYLTAEVAKGFNEKVRMALESILFKKDIE